MKLIDIYSAGSGARGISPTSVTRRESEVLDLAHLTYREIGAELGIAEETVRTHLKHARLKLGAENTRAAVLAWRDRRAA